MEYENTDVSQPEWLLLFTWRAARNVHCAHLSWSLWTNTHPYAGMRTFTSTVAHGFRPLEGKSPRLVLLLFVPFGSLFTMVLGKIWNSCWIWFGNLALFITSRALPHLAPILGDWHPVSVKGGSGICMFPALHKGLWYVVMTKSHLWGPRGPW